MKSPKFIVSLVIVLTVAVVLALSYRRDQLQQRNEEALALRRYGEEAAQLNAAIGTMLQDMIAAAETAREKARAASNAVQTVTGEPFRLQPATAPKPEPRRRPREREATAAEPAARSRPERDRDVPPGMPTREELDRMREAHATAAKKPDPEEKPVPEEKPEPEEEPDPAPAEPEIVAIARRIVGEAEAVLDRERRMRDLAESAAQKTRQATSARNSRLAAELADDLRIKHVSASGLRDSARKILADIETPARRAAEMKKAAQEAADRRRTEEQRQRAEEQHRQQVQNERNAVRTAWENSRKRLARFRYSQALNELKARRALLETDEAKAMADVAIERYEQLQELHRFLIQRINAKRYRWGWGSGSSAQDIVAANENYLRISTENIRWEDVDRAQMVRMLRFYVEDDDLPRRERGQRELALAVFYAENEMEAPARDLTEDVLHRYPTLRDKAERLLVDVDGP